MRTRLFAAVLVLALLLPALTGCAYLDEAECPVTEFDSEKTLERNDGLSVTLKQKRVTLENENAELVLVENNSDRAVSIDVIAKYTEEDGTFVSISTNKITAIPARYSGFVIFSPGTRYGVCELIAQIEEYEGETLLQYLTTGYGLGLVVAPMYDLNPNSPYREKGYNPYEANVDDHSVTSYKIEYGITSTSERDIHVSGYLIGLDSDGDAIFLTRRAEAVSKNKHIYSSMITFEDKPWDDNMTVPDNLLGDLYCIYAIESTEWEDEYQEKLNKIVDQARNPQTEKNGG